MRRILLLCLLTLIVQPLLAQKYLVIYRLNGDVQLRRVNATEWTRAARRDALEWADLLHIPADGNVRILDLRDSSFYQLGPSGAITVRQQIEAAKKQADNITGRLNEEILADLKDQRAGTPGYSVKGVSYRGEAADDTFIRELAAALLAHAEGDAPLSYEMVNEDDGGFHFILHNRSSAPLFVNVLRRSPGKINVCFETSTARNKFILIPGGKSLELSAYSFLAGAGQFTVFGTEKPVDSRALLRALNTAEAKTSIPDGAMIGNKQ